jgi:uncharacterized protein YlxP (DUF503 family)
MNSIIRDRRKMILRIAEQLQEHFNLNTQTMKSWDIDEACEIIDTELPQTYDEMEAEFNTASTYVEVNRIGKPSVLSQLREVLEITDDKIPLIEVVKAAIEKLNANK